MSARPIMGDEHEAFRASFSTFLDREIVPRYASFEAAGIVDRSVWRDAGRHGFLCPEVPERYGGAGATDFRFNAVIGEELNSRVLRGFGLPAHNDIVLSYLMRLATDEQKQRWLPGMVSGELISSIAMTEPGAGSDLGRLRTSAKLNGSAGHYVVNGQKTFITNGQNADLVLTAVRTSEHPYRGLSLVMIERGMPGFERGRNLEKLGIHAQDTSELFFDDVAVPVENRLGEQDRGFAYLIENLPRERLSIAVGAVAAAERTLELTLGYVKERPAFGGVLADLQNTQFVLAELATEIRINRVFVDDCVMRHNRQELDADSAAMAKLSATELQVKVADRCLQLHGGYGYMEETEVGRMWRDSRPQTIYGGTSEVMKHIIGRSLHR